MINKPKVIKDGLIVILDGVDGVGKTTQLNLVKEALEASGWQVYTSRNLGGTPIGEDLRKVLLSPINRPPLVNLYVSVAIQEALIEDLNRERKKGSIILIDRGPLSLVAYQSYGSGINKRLGWHYADQGINNIKPELMIIYSLDVMTAINRSKLRSKNQDYFEIQPKAYFERVKKGYQAGIKKYQASEIEVLGSINDVHQLTMSLINQSIINKQNI